MRAAALLALSIGGAACGRIDFGGSRPADDITGLVVVYPMDDDPSGGSVTASVPALSGTCGPTCPASVPGVFDNAIMFHGDTAETVELPTSTLVGDLPYTVALWLMPVERAVNSSIVAKPINSGNHDVINLQSQTAFPVRFETSNGDFDYLTSYADVSTGWHHIAASWDGTTKRLYVDGALAGSEVTTTIDSTRNIYVGADLDGGVPVYPCDGAIDDLRFYDRALDDYEVAMIATPP